LPEYNYIMKKLKKEEKFNYRYDLVKFAFKTSKKEASREYKADIKVVRKWVERYKKYGIAGLKDLSTAPKTIPNKCSDSFEKQVIKLRLQTKNKFGASKLIERFNLKHSKNCVQRIINQAGLKRKKKTKTAKRNNLWSAKKLTKVFEKIQIDVKTLTDIDLYWLQYNKQKLPKFEFTARDVKTGASFVCFADRNNSRNASSFALYVTNHLKEAGFEVKEITIQTDNGAEFNACGNSKKQDTMFEHTVKDIINAKLDFIPPASPTFNSDVETFHRLVEDEFYSIEFIENRDDLIKKMYTYLIDFNYLRKNSYKDNKTPIKLAREDIANISLGIFNLKPIFLDNNFNLYLDAQKKYLDQNKPFIPTKRNPINPKKLKKINHAFDNNLDSFLEHYFYTLGGDNVTGLHNLLINYRKIF
jgi:transposase